LVSGGEDGVVRVWDADAGRQLHELAGSTGWVGSVAVSADGRRLVSGGDDGVVRVWDADTGQRLRELTGSTTGWVGSVAVSADGRRLVSGGENGVVRVWAETGRQVRELTGHTRTVWSVAVSADGRRLVSGGVDGVVRVWDGETGQRLRELTVHTDRVLSVAVSADGRRLVSGGDDGVVRVWDADTGQRLRELTGHTRTVWSVAVSADGRRLVSGGEDGTVRVWDADTGQQLLGAGADHATPPRPLAELSSDEPSADDQLGIASDVDTLAALIAAASTQAPLSIAVLGRWGAGKSSFMRQMERRITELLKPPDNPDSSVFLGAVRQVRFNAWHYSDDHLWVGLVEELFRTLRPPENAGPAPDLDVIRREREQARLDLDRADAAQRNFAAAPRGAGRWDWLLHPHAYLAGIRALAADEGRDLRASRRVLLGWLAVLIAGLVVGVACAVLLRSWIVAAVSIAAPMAAATIRFLPKVTKSISGLRSGQERVRARLDQRVLSARARLAQVDAAERLLAFLYDAQRDARYEQYRGLLGRVHRDLLELSDHLQTARAEWVADGSRDAPPLQRIVLYIDDLDRCPPRRVVDVLAATHLLLALPLFVVVVAVDPHWLVQSLRRVHGEWFALPDEPEPGVRPLDYLDKIFQVPYALRPQPPEATERYLRSLVPEVDDGLTADRPEPGGTVPAVTPVPVGDAATPAAATGGPPPPSRPAPEQDLEEDPEQDRLSRHALDRDVISAVHASQHNLHWAGLRLRSVERDFLGRLGTLVPTPRAAKKLVNLYRLLRISIPEPQLPTFVGTTGTGPYRQALLLLAIVVGHPTLARPLLIDLAAAKPQTDLADLLRTRATDEERDDAQSWQSLAGAVSAIVTNAAMPTAAADYQQWCATVARFSFETYDLVTAQGPPNLPVDITTPEPAAD